MSVNNLDMYKNTMIGQIAGIDMTESEYRKWYNDACKDNDKTRRVKTNYLMEKLKAYNMLKDFEYRYIYDASACNHTRKFIFNVVPALILMYLHFNILSILFIVPLICTILFNIIFWCPILLCFIKKHSYIKFCFYLNLSAIFLDSYISYLILKPFFRF